MSLRRYRQQRLLQRPRQPHPALQTRHPTPTQKSSNETFKPTWRNFHLYEEALRVSSSDKVECSATLARSRELLPPNAISASSRSSGLRIQASPFYLVPNEVDRLGPSLSSFDLYLLLKTNFDNALLLTSRNFKMYILFFDATVIILFSALLSLKFEAARHKESNSNYDHDQRVMHSVKTNFPSACVC